MWLRMYEITVGLVNQSPLRNVSPQHNLLNKTFLIAHEMTVHKNACIETTSNLQTHFG